MSDNSTTNSKTNGTISYPPFFEVTDDNNGPYAVVVAFCSIALIILIAAIRFIIAKRMKINLELDDGTFALSAVIVMEEPVIGTSSLRNHRFLASRMHFASTKPSSPGLGDILKTWTRTI
jgi:hypothetical protein